MHRSRRGFSLMEVMLATSVLLGSSVALIELASIGRKQANAAYDLNLAQLLCQAKLDEIVAEVSPATSVEEQELEDEPGWFYSVETQPLRSQNLVAVKVSVFQGEQQTSRAAHFSLVRWLPGRSPKAANTAPSEPSNQSLSVPPRRNQRREDTP